jgi:hypothetical protein
MRGDFRDGEVGETALATNLGKADFTSIGVTPTLSAAPGMTRYSRTPGDAICCTLHHETSPFIQVAVAQDFIESEVVELFPPVFTWSLL